MLVRLPVLLVVGVGLISAVAQVRVPPTFSADVAPILYRRCTSCHSDRSVAPFSLVGYENARQFATTIEEVTRTGQMPPWKAIPGYGEFRDVAALTAVEKKT